TGLHSLVRALFPTLGIVHSEKAIVNISAEVEITANSRTDAIGWLKMEMNSLKEVVFQNSMVVDMTTTQMGGVCMLINISCRSYMDQSGQITTNIP
ncbi:ERVV2 protein, partial [Pheucticus melanocephalus]|nr:ERVV2 protein [Pheucticus melanocephalus]